jgi:hypothetical protein
MNKDAVKAVLNESAALVDASVELEKHATDLEQKNASLTKQAAASAAEVTRLNKVASDFTTAVREGATKTAEYLVARGFTMDKQAFIDRLSANPLEMFGVIEKVANQATAPQLGAGDESAAAASSLDPIERFVTGG